MKAFTVHYVFKIARFTDTPWCSTNFKKKQMKQIQCCMK